MRKKTKTTSTRQNREEKTTTLQDVLNHDVLEKLKAKAEDLKKEEAKKLEEQRKQLEESRLQEEKRLESNFEHLLTNSKLDWRKYK